jgi:hypothetical protein
LLVQEIDKQSSFMLGSNQIGMLENMRRPVAEEDEDS